MIAFHGKPGIKEFYLARAKAHFAADEIVKGKYWANGHRCAVGCLIHSDSHADLAEALSIPLQLAHLIDGIFEGMSNGHAKSFPMRFIESIPVGAELAGVIDRFLLTLLSDPHHGVIACANEAARKPIQDMIDLFARQVSGESISTPKWHAAADAMRQHVLQHPIEATVWAARATVWAARARGGVLLVGGARAEAAAWAAAWAAWQGAWGRGEGGGASNHYLWQSEMLLSLLADAPVPAAA